MMRIHNHIGGLDYAAVLNQQLTFSPSVRSHIVHVGILDDDFLEKDIENFTCTLSVDVPRLQLVTQSAIVNIADNDSKQSCNNMYMLGYY